MTNNDTVAEIVEHLKSVAEKSKKPIKVCYEIAIYCADNDIHVIPLTEVLIAWSKENK